MRCFLVAWSLHLQRQFPRKTIIVQKEMLQRFNPPSAEWNFTLNWFGNNSRSTSFLTFPSSLGMFPSSWMEDKSNPVKDMLGGTFPDKCFLGRYRIESLVSRPKEGGIFPSKLQFTTANSDKALQFPKLEER